MALNTHPPSNAEVKERAELFLCNISIADNGINIALVFLGSFISKINFNIILPPASVSLKQSLNLSVYYR